MEKRSIVWFRNDLRLQDNVVLHEAIKRSDKIYPVYCFDERDFQKLVLGFHRTGYFRAKFLLECIGSLRQALQAMGTDLIVRYGKPEVVLPTLAAEWQVQVVYGSKEVGNGEIIIEKHTEEALLRNNIELQLIWQSTLLHVEDIPWPIKNVPNVFSQFRKEAEKTTPVRQSIGVPSFVNGPKQEDKIGGQIPSLEQLGFTCTQKHDARAVLLFVGGEEQGLIRMHQYVWETDHISHYKLTRNEMLGDAYSSKLSPWLAKGCVSPRVVYEEIIKYEKSRSKNKSTYSLILELLWRDFFKFITKKYGGIFSEEAIQTTSITPDEFDKFEKWKNGETGVPFIDANMRELNATGFMSNRGRQNVASFLIHDLEVNWMWGATYFESMLIDHDVASNWGNWSYLAGMGNNLKEGHSFNIFSQAYRYDPQGAYVRKWIPELAEIPGRKIHFPTTSEVDEKRYPRPLVSFNKWVY